MNREISFKAKGIDTGDWIEGIPSYDRDGNISEIERFEPGEEGCFVDIDPKTLCQYTGLTDKNGKEIWENDIIRHEQIETIGTICWYEEDYVGFAVNDIYDGMQQYDIGMFADAKVIGNIFDNPELLEDAK